MIKHTVQRDIRKVLRIEREESTFYGLHNMESWSKIKDKYKYFIIIHVDELTIRVVKYTNDIKKAESFAGMDPRYILMKDWENDEIQT